MNTKISQPSHIQGKIYLITGATSGLGKATAIALASAGATVVGVGRNPAKCVASADEIKTRSGNPAVDFLLADLSSQAEIRSLATQFTQKYPHLNVLVNIAGGTYKERRESIDAIELNFALNHLGYFLLTNLLLDALKAGSPSRVIVVSSGLHKTADLDWVELK